MAEMKMGVVESHFADIIWANEPFSWVFSPSHLVSCYIVLLLFTNLHKGKNKGKDQLRKHCF